MRTAWTKNTEDHLYLPTYLGRCKLAHQLCDSWDRAHKTLRYGHCQKTRMVVQHTNRSRNFACHGHAQSCCVHSQWLNSSDCNGLSWIYWQPPVGFMCLLESISTKILSRYYLNPYRQVCISSVEQSRIYDWASSRFLFRSYKLIYQCTFQIGFQSAVLW